MDDHIVTRRFFNNIPTVQNLGGGVAINSLCLAPKMSATEKQYKPPHCLSASRRRYLWHLRNRRRRYHTGAVPFLPCSASERPISLDLYAPTASD